MTDVTGRIAFITGGANGIGLGLARVLARSGVKLGIADVDTSALEKAKAELSTLTQVEVVQLDVRDREAFASAANAVEMKLGQVSLLINNAGVVGQGNVRDISFELWDWVLQINLGGVINGIQTFLPRMLDNKNGGHIVNTASASGLVGGTASISYCTAKFGVVGLSESLRAELRDDGIGVSVLCPGPVATDIFSHSIKIMPPESESVPSARLREAQMSAVLQKGVTPDDVGRMVARAIARNQFYIHTDSIMLTALEERHSEIMEAMPEAPRKTYADERPVSFNTD